MKIYVPISTLKAASLLPKTNSLLPHLESVYVECDELNPLITRTVAVVENHAIGVFCDQLPEGVHRNSVTPADLQVQRQSTLRDPSNPSCIHPAARPSGAVSIPVGTINKLKVLKQQMEYDYAEITIEPPDSTATTATTANGQLQAPIPRRCTLTLPYQDPIPFDEIPQPYANYRRVVSTAPVDTEAPPFPPVPLDSDLYVRMQKAVAVWTKAQNSNLGTILRLVPILADGTPIRVRVEPYHRFDDRSFVGMIAAVHTKDSNWPKEADLKRTLGITD